MWLRVAIFWRFHESCDRASWSTSFKIARIKVKDQQPGRHRPSSSQMSYASVAAHNAPPSSQQPHPDKTLYTTENDVTGGSLPDLTHTVNVAPSNFKSDPRVSTIKGIIRYMLILYVRLLPRKPPLSHTSLPTTRTRTVLALPKSAPPTQRSAHARVSKTPRRRDYTYGTSSRSVSCALELRVAFLVSVRHDPFPASQQF
jgi:hypothetical protein